MADAAAVLSVTGLRASFRAQGVWRPVVQDLSFDIQPGETLAVVGESGSGKSITALSIMRLLPENHSRIEGSIRLAGTELLSLTEAQMQRVRGNDVAMIFQEPMTSLNPAMSIGRQIGEALMWHRGMARAQADAEVLRLLEKVRIPAARSRFHEYPHRFSGGMRQRVMIAMALACQPRLLIADEPTTALDVTIQAQILTLVRELQREEPMAVLFITHDMGVVAEIADRMVVLRGGEAVETGATRDIFARPAHPYTRSLLAAVPRLGSMQGHAQPTPFPRVDAATGQVDPPVEGPDTVVWSAPPALSVQHLTTRFDIREGPLRRLSGRIHAVEEVSLTVQPGETLAIVGESGCGKSTLGRSIVGLVQPRGGSVLVGGEDVLHLRGRALQAMRRKVQMVFQDPFASLDPRVRIGDAIAEPLVVHRIGTAATIRAKVAALLQRVGLSAAMASRFPHEFSGGQRQRICIARALALEPSVIVADEAVSALDVSVKAQVVNLMLELQASLKIAYLFISHDMAVVERVAHRVAVMYLGEIVETGSRAAIFGNPRHPYTQRLMAAIPVPDPTVLRAPASAGNAELRSPLRAPDYVRPARALHEVAPGHWVQTWGPEWTAAA